MTPKPAAAKTDDDTINLSLDEWVGWKSLVDACGGLTTQPGSIFDQLDIKVNINIINDATQSSNALISGDLQAAGYTTNRVAFLSQKFKEAGKNVIMPFYTNYSYGGDGIIASTNFADISTCLMPASEYPLSPRPKLWLPGLSRNPTSAPPTSRRSSIT